MWHDKLRRGSGVVDEMIGGGGGEEGGSEERQRGEEGCEEVAYNIYTNEYLVVQEREWSAPYVAEEREWSGR